MVATTAAFGVGMGSAAAGTVTVPVDDYGTVEVPVQAYATGWPFGLVNLFGGLPTLPDGIGELSYRSSWHPRDFYNAIAGISTDARIDLDTEVGGVSISDEFDVMARAAVVASFGLSSYSAMEAYRMLAEATEAQPLPAGYIPIDPAPGAADVPFRDVKVGSTTVAMYQNPALPNTLGLALALLRDPGTPNGGIAARFAPLLALVGIDTVTRDVKMIVPEGFDLSDPYSVEMRQTETEVCIPVLGCSPVVYDVPAAVTNWDGGAMLLPLKITGNWEYDPVGDFPATINPIALANSLVAGLLPTYILRGLDTDELGEQISDKLSAAGDAIVDGLSNGDPQSSEITAALNSYLTVRATSLPLLEPFRLPLDLVNAVFGTNLRNPFADALEPALKILVNIGYTDVVTPADIEANPELEVYGEYGRTLDEMGDYTPFMSRSPLTLEESLRVPGDVLTALLTGIYDVLTGHYPAEPEQTSPTTGESDEEVETAASQNPAAASAVAVSDVQDLGAESDTFDGSESGGGSENVGEAGSAGESESVGQSETADQTLGDVSEEAIESELELSGEAESDGQGADSTTGVAAPTSEATSGAQQQSSADTDQTASGEQAADSDAADNAATGARNYDGSTSREKVKQSLG